MRRMREQFAARVRAIAPRDYLIIGGVVVAVFAIHFTVRSQSGKKTGTEIAATQTGDDLSLIHI